MSGDDQNQREYKRATRLKTCPFRVEPLKTDDAPASSDRPLRLVLPASFRSGEDNLTASTKDVATCIQAEFDLRRIETVFHWLWIVGRPMPPRPLHHQILLSRHIFITEQMDMHLVWTSGRMFIKPIPRFLLMPDFWSDHLACLPGCICQVVVDSAAGSNAGNAMCHHHKLRRSALGFLFSYAALVSHESDFIIAQDKHLLPPQVSWADWTILIEQVLAMDHIYRSIHPRFIYGELRLSRLNKIYSITQPPFLRGYMSQWQRYGDFFHDNFAVLAASTIYIVVVLTAMQVGLATDSLSGNADFQSASYGFTVFSIIGPLGALGLIALCFTYIFLNNLIVAIRYKTRRFKDIGVVDDSV